MQDENLKCAMHRNWILLKFQKQNDMLKHRKLKEGFNEVEEFQQQNAIVPVAGEWFQEGWVPYVD